MQPPENYHSIENMAGNYFILYVRVFYAHCSTKYILHITGSQENTDKSQEKQFFDHSRNIYVGKSKITTNF